MNTKVHSAMGKIGKTIGLGVCAAAVLAVQPVGATGAPEESESDQVAAYADAFGISRELAVEDSARQSAISRTVSAIEEKFGDRSFDIWLEGGIEEPILMVRSEDDRVISALSPLEDEGVSVKRIDEAVQGENLIKRVEAAGSTLGAGGQIEGVYGDIRTREVVVQVSDDQQLTRITSVPTEKPYRVERVETMSDSGVVRGGAAMSTCTVGFVGVLGGIGYGFMTADHCGAKQAVWSGTSTSGRSLGTFSRAASSKRSTSDISFFLTPGHSTPPYFYGQYGATALRVSGKGTAVYGQRVCHRGKTTGYSCGTVTSTSYRPTWENACNGASCQATFVSVKGAKNKGGDSGGPWFAGTTALGIHKGGSDTIAVYSKLSYSPGALKTS